MVREVLKVPIVGTVPAIKPAAAMTQTGVIGLLGTAATIRQGYVDRLEAEFARGKRLIRHAAPELVAAAEAVLRGEAARPGGVRRRPRGLALAARRRGHRHGGARLHPLPARRGASCARRWGQTCGSSTAPKASRGGSPPDRRTAVPRAKSTDFALFTGDAGSVRPARRRRLRDYGLERTSSRSSCESLANSAL